jgi:MFS family permease
LRAVAGLAVLCALSFLIEDAVQNWSALQLEREVGSGAALGGAAPGIFAGAMFGGRSAGQWLGARFTDRSLLVGGALGAALGLLLLAYAPNVPIAIVGLVLAGAGVALVAPALFARAGRSAGARGRGAAIASLTVFGYTGFLVGPAIIGLLSQAAGLRFALAALSGAAMLLALGGMLVLRAPGRRGTFATGEELLRTGRG